MNECVCGCGRLANAYRGLSAACYGRLRRAGRLDLYPPRSKRVVLLTGPRCACGCGALAGAKPLRGLAPTCYARLWHAGKRDGVDYLAAYPPQRRVVGARARLNWHVKAKETHR